MFSIILTSTTASNIMDMKHRDFSGVRATQHNDFQTLPLQYSTISKTMCQYMPKHVISRQKYHQKSWHIVVTLYLLYGCRPYTSGNSHFVILRPVASPEFSRGRCWESWNGIAEPQYLSLFLAYYLIGNVAVTNVSPPLILNRKTLNFQCMPAFLLRCRKWFSQVHFHFQWKIKMNIFLGWP